MDLVLTAARLFTLSPPPPSRVGIHRCPFADRRLSSSQAALLLLGSYRSDLTLHYSYAGCFSYLERRSNMEVVDPTPDVVSSHDCSLTTRFIDDRLLSTMSSTDDLRQVVLLTDGMDARPFRLCWPRTCVIYDVSPDEVFHVTSKRLTGVGAKISRMCKLVHIPLESSDLSECLHKKGLNGNKPSIWVLQGLPLIPSTRLSDIMFLASTLAMRGSIFIGELSSSFIEADCGTMDEHALKSVEMLFMKHGFCVDVIGYDEVTRSFQQSSAVGDYDKFLFVAEHMRFSDVQMENWSSEFQRLEEAGDEEGFEEL